MSVRRPTLRGCHLLRKPGPKVLEIQSWGKLSGVLPTRRSWNIFLLAMGLTFWLMVAINWASYLHLRANPPLADWYEECGFPFGFYGRGGFVGFDGWLWAGLIVDVLFALATSLLVGAVVAKVYEQLVVSPKEKRQ